MLVKSNVINKEGKELYVNSITGDHGTLASHFGKALRSERKSRRDAIYKTPQVGLVNNNRKRTNARKIHVITHLNTAISKTDEKIKVIPITKFKSFKVENTTIRLPNGKFHIMKEHYRDVLRPSSKKIVSVPQ